MVKASALRAADPGFDSQLCQDFSRSSHTSDLEIGTPVTTLPGAWCYRVSSGTSWPCVSILWLGEMESWICNFYLIVAARKIVQISPVDTLAFCWSVKQPTNIATVWRFKPEQSQSNSFVRSCFFQLIFFNSDLYAQVCFGGLSPDCQHSFSLSFPLWSP